MEVKVRGNTWGGETTPRGYLAGTGGGRFFSKCCPNWKEKSHVGQWIESRS